MPSGSPHGNTARTCSAIVWNPGKLVIVALVAIGLAAALFSQWYHRQSGRRALEFWGTETAVLIAQAPEIEVFELQAADVPPSAHDQRVTPERQADSRPIQRLGIGGRSYRVVRAKDASHARGVSNIRRAMVLDATYQWDAAAAAEKPAFQYAIEFRDGDRGAIVFFDFDRGQVGSTGSTTTVALDPSVVADWRSFCQEQFDEALAK